MSYGDLYRFAREVLHSCCCCWPFHTNYRHIVSIVSEEEAGLAPRTALQDRHHDKGSPDEQAPSHSTLRTTPRNQEELARALKGKGFGKAASSLSLASRESDGEEVCSTCLEGYSDANPKILTACCHPFHLACILEWMERLSQMQRPPSCPICERELSYEDVGCD